MAKTQDITEGAKRFLSDLGYACLCEFTLSNDRRVDVIGLNKKGEIYIIEIKSGLEDFRSDQKWPEYLDFCDYFAFAVDEDFPQDILPQNQGLIIADRFEGVCIREAHFNKLNGSRRKSITLKFARIAAQRLELGSDKV
ncbi:MAG: MmcB family DNA repair protein [Methylocystaceae bacterium]|nr:MmcB family DNA repair protein [Methylocystaceae bacterium]